jgi:4-hydroxy-2-oxoheptanedioate aldolase
MTMSPLLPSQNALKAKLARGETVLGIWSIIPSPVVVEILGLSGLDFTILDMEHGIFDMATLDGCIRAAESGGAVPLVRIPGMNASAVQWALDMGAHGIVVPQVCDASHAATVVEMAKYAPAGTRGYNPFTRAANYANPPDNRSGKLSNGFSLTCVIIESAVALGNLESICATPGLDVVYVGVYDLAVALGCEGNTGHPRIVEVLESSVRRIRASGKAAGMMVRNAQDIARAGELGANFLVFGVDTALLREAAINAVAMLAGQTTEAQP